MEEGDDGGDEAEAEGGLMVHRGAEVIMHSKGAFPCDVVCYMCLRFRWILIYVLIYVCAIKRGVSIIMICVNQGIIIVSNQHPRFAPVQPYRAYLMSLIFQDNFSKHNNCKIRGY